MALLVRATVLLVLLQLFGLAALQIRYENMASQLHHEC